MSCRITRSNKGEGVVAWRGVVRSVFPSVLARQGNAGDETACRLNPQAGRMPANTRCDGGTAIWTKQERHREISNTS